MNKKEYTRENHDVAVLLHDIRSAHNVGSIFRTADALGVSRILLSGYTPCPLDRFLRPNKEIAKTALGAEKTIPWEYVQTPEEVILHAHQESRVIVGLEQDPRAVDYKTYRVTSPTLFLVGNEVLGLSGALREACDVLIEIPMCGQKESLNVSVSFGVALFQILGV